MQSKILQIGKELMRTGVTGAVKSFLSYDAIEISPPSYRGTGISDSTQWIFGSNGIDYHFKFHGHASSLKAYECCPPVNAIINRKAQAYINGKTWVLNTQDKESNNEAAKKLRELMKKPNPLQSWKQFEAQGYIYQQLFGYNIVLPIKPAGFPDNIDAKYLWNIPPSMVDIEETNKLFYQTDTSGIIKQLVLNYRDQRTVIDVKDIFIMKDITPSFLSLVVPESRIRALELVINNIIGCYESRNVLINYRGALGILSKDIGTGAYGELPMKEEDKVELQEDLKRYGLRNRQWQFIISSAALKWQQMGVATKDLMLFEEIEDDICRLCDGLGYPDYLMSSRQKTTFDNLNEGKKFLYNDFIIPDAESIYEQWNSFFETDKFNIRMEKDYSHVAVLQEDDQKKSSAREIRNRALEIEWRNNLITRNYWRRANGDDPVPGDDIYFNGTTEPQKVVEPQNIIDDGNTNPSATE